MSVHVSLYIDIDIEVEVEVDIDIHSPEISIGPPLLLICMTAYIIICFQIFTCYSLVSRKYI